MMYKIIIIEDETKIANELKIMLEPYGYECHILENFTDVVSQIKEFGPNLILLDVNLPVYDGYYILRKIREYSETPVILVTSRDTEIDELAGMNLGADDFITKPYNNNILLARINRLIKRTSDKNESNLIKYKGIILNVSSGEVSSGDNKIELSKNESQILEYMMNNKSKILLRNDIIECLWQSDQFIDDNTLTVNITRLRKKLEQIGVDDYIKTKRGQGYIV